VVGIRVQYCIAHLGILVQYGKEGVIALQFTITRTVQTLYRYCSCKKTTSTSTVFF
jgi:hypothetical protein